ncbi:MAG TPA: HIT domain-containing protein [Patescibacteria group bacterium]|nr:HIT domain-containing protein [Patescibacteria group bacterium]
MSERQRVQSIGFDHEHSPEFCIFCEIIRGQTEASIIVKDLEKGVISFMDLQGYPLVCPIEHVDSTPESLNQNADVLAEVSRLAYKLVPLVYEAFSTDGVNIVTNLGESAGQEIPHIHTHVIPRVRHDRRVQMLRVPNLSRQKLDARAAQLRGLLSDTEF